MSDSHFLTFFISTQKDLDNLHKDKFYAWDNMKVAVIFFKDSIMIFIQRIYLLVLSNFFYIELNNSIIQYDM